MKSTNLLRLGVYHEPTTRTGVAYLIKLFYRLYTSQNRDDGVRSDGASTNYGNIMNHEEPRMNGITATERLINDFWGTFYLSSFSPDFQDWDSLSSPRDESGTNEEYEAALDLTTTTRIELKGRAGKMIILERESNDLSLKA
nr:hypothetical protein Iba_chr14fCG8150 [Ipomoea batatas]